MKVQPKVSAILLAAGNSSRMGCCKQLLPLDDQPVIAHCLSAIMAADFSEIMVVVGRQHQQLEREIRKFAAAIVCYPQPQSDMTASVRAGLQALSLPVTGVLVCLADHPLVSADTYRFLLRQHLLEPRKIIIPVCEGKRGHPTLFPSHLLQELHTLPTLRDIIRLHPDLVLLSDITDRGVAIDMDTPDDYLKILAYGATI